MPSIENDRLKSVEAKIGHVFRDGGLLQGALTHSSVETKARTARTSEDFERLEFLGDRVLGLVVAAELLGRFPGEKEGALAKRFTALVDRKTLAEIAGELSLGDDLFLSKGESRTGGARKSTVLADTLEAVIGAVYLDAGMDVARKMIQTLWKGRFREGQGAVPDPKTSLQEWAQGQGLGLPVYRETGKSGLDHAPVFEIELELKGCGKIKAQGASKRDAQKKAAAMMLEKISDGGKSHG